MIRPMTPPTESHPKHTSAASKVRLLLWKNYLLQKRHKVHTIVDIFLPVCVFLHKTNVSSCIYLLEISFCCHCLHSFHVWFSSRYVSLYFVLGFNNPLAQHQRTKRPIPIWPSSLILKSKYCHFVSNISANTAHFQCAHHIHIIDGFDTSVF